MEMQPQVGSSGKVGKKQLNNDLVGNLRTTLQSAEIFTLSKTHFGQLVHLFIGNFRSCVGSDFGEDLWLLFVVYWRIWWQPPVGRSDIEEVVRYRDGYCLLSGEPININGLTPAKTSPRNQNFLRYQIL